MATVGRGGRGDQGGGVGGGEPAAERVYTMEPAQNDEANVVLEELTDTEQPPSSRIVAGRRKNLLIGTNGVTRLGISRSIASTVVGPCRTSQALNTWNAATTTVHAA
jgi:hypothetical protein